MPGVQVAPVKALAGQRSTQTLQPPQRLFSTGASNGSGASVKRLESRTAPPYRSVMSRQFLPIHPSPAWTATVLCGSGERQFSSVLTVSVVLAKAR